jgi:2-oxoisovalerate dehydrogenase E1 component
LGSAPTPAIPLNSDLEAELLPNAEKVSVVISEILNY